VALFATICADFAGRADAVDMLLTVSIAFRC